MEHNVSSNQNEIAKFEHDRTYQVKKVSNFVSDGSGNIVREQKIPLNREGQVVVNMPLSQFGEVIVTNRTPIIELNSSYGVSVIRDVTSNTNTGAITPENGELKLSTGATADSQVQIDSAEAGRYVPGYGAEVGVGIRIPTSATGNKYAEWGGHDVTENNGFFFGNDATGTYVAIRRDGTTRKTYQADWNIDTFDGNGQSGINLDLAEGSIYSIQFTWYGYGGIVYGIIQTVDNQQRFFPCHNIEPDGETSVQSPNLTVFARAFNQGDASNFDVYVGGRQYSIVGQYRPKYRFAAQARTGVATSTTSTPIISFRSKTGFLNRSVRVKGLEIIPNTENIIAEIRLNGVLTGASYQTPTNHTASEQAVETDISATAISNGTVIWSELFEAGKKNDSNSLATNTLDIDIPQDQPCTLCVRTLTGTGTVTANFRVEEEW